MPNLDHMSRTYPTSIMLHFKICSFEQNSTFSVIDNPYMGTLTLQDVGKLPYPVLEGDMRSRARALATIHSHPVVSREGSYHCANLFACTSTPLSYSTSTLISPISVGWKLGWVELLWSTVFYVCSWNWLILNLGFWDLRVPSPPFETVSDYIQWVYYSIHILFPQYCSLNRCVASIYYYDKWGWNFFQTKMFDMPQYVNWRMFYSIFLIMSIWYCMLKTGVGQDKLHWPSLLRHFKIIVGHDNRWYWCTFCTQTWHIKNKICVQKVYQYHLLSWSTIISETTFTYIVHHSLMQMHIFALCKVIGAKQIIRV